MIPAGPAAWLSAIISAMEIDVRGPRFGAALTTLVLAVVLITGSGWLLAVQAAFFAVGAAAGCRTRRTAGSSAAWCGPGSVRHAATEDAAPPRFAQAVGLVFSVVGVIGYAVGPQWLGLAATACALAAAFLNAAFAYCLGCEMYLLLKRATA